MHFCEAVIELFIQDGLNIIAHSGRPEVASDAIFGETVEVIEIDLLWKCHDPNSNRSRVIQLHHLVTHTQTRTHTRDSVALTRFSDKSESSR